MRSRLATSRLLILLPLLSTFAPAFASAADPLELARAGRYIELASVGGAALVPLLSTYPTADRETRTIILLALGSLNIKSAAAKAILDTDVDSEDSSFQDLHRYALAVVDPAVRSTDLHELVTAEGVPLDPELGRFMYATLVTTYDQCDARVEHARRYVAGLAAADPKARYAAIVSLRIMTGASHAYHPWATDAARAEPLRAWRRWLRRLEQSCRA